MKEYLQLRKFISGLMIIGLLAQLSGCVSSRSIISSSEIPVSDKYYYLIHGQKSIYLLENVSISNGILSGKVDINKSVFVGRKIHIYLPSDSFMKVNTDETLSIPLKDIKTVEVIKVATGKTLLLVIGSTIGLILLLGALSFPGWHPF